jgi:zinc/manganese transport system substrate-binding protein
VDDWVKIQIAQVPEGKRKVISTHNAFGYFSKAYHVTFLAPQGLNTEAQPSAADVARLIDQIRNAKITAVFFENMTDSRLISQLEKDAGAHVGGTLYSDALSIPGEPAPTYLAMFRHNVPELVKAMQDNPTHPESGAL